MKILLRKISDERHALRLVREGGASEEIEQETRSTLVHDLIHYAVEAEAAIATGFWGSLAAGVTLGEMNDRTQAALGARAGELAAVERIVGVLSSAAKGRPAGEVVDGLRRYAASLDTTMPEWLTEPFVKAVQERLRRLLGRWRATAYGAEMAIVWGSGNRDD